MNRRNISYYIFLLVLSVAFYALGDYQNINATITRSDLSEGILNNNLFVNADSFLDGILNNTLTNLTQSNDETAGPTEENNLVNDCSDCGGNDGSSSNGDGERENRDGNDGDRGDSRSSSSNGDGERENRDGNDGDRGDRNSIDNVNPQDLPFSLPFNSQFADHSNNPRDNIHDKIPFP